MGSIMSSTGHMYQQHQLHPALQTMHRVSPYQAQGHAYSETAFPENNVSTNMGCLYQDYQVRHMGLCKNPVLYLVENVAQT